MLYLYVKTHNKTGLKYLGKTEKDPQKYKGSGKYWKRHVKKYGYDVTTEVIFESVDIEIFKQKCIYYSKLWNIVDSPEWANLVEENGVGGSNTRSAKLAWKTKRLNGTDNINTSEAIAKCKETKLKNKTNHKEIMSRPDVLHKQREGVKNKWKDPEYRKKQERICPHCGKIGYGGLMLLKHFDNCKKKKGG